MAASEPRHDIKEYADGWITEREGTPIPAFLKLAYVVVALGCIGYAILYMNGETTHDSRGPLVQEFNRLTGTADGFMYLVAALAAVFAVVLWTFAFGRDEH